MDTEENPNTAEKRKLSTDEESDQVEAKRISVGDEPPEENNSDTDRPPVNNVEKIPIFNGVEITKLTKRQLKKYHKMLRFQEVKKLKRARDRVKTKWRKMEARTNNIDLGPSRRQLKRCTMANSSCKVSVVIDLSFDDLMITKDHGKTVKQILRAYTANRRAANPVQFYLTSFEGIIKEEMAKHHGYEHWDINFREEDYLKVFPKEKLIYLTSESDNIIRELEDDKVYIIGGLVDHNSHKGICYKKAIEQGIGHGQLPIDDYFKIKFRKVFTINQVFEILVRVTEGKTFKEAFEEILPKRIDMQPTDPPENENQNPM